MQKIQLASEARLTNGQIVELLGLPESIITDITAVESETYVPASNRFLTALVNKITYQVVESVSFENPFKKYDGFKIAFGTTIENIFVDMPQGYKYDPTATNPFEIFKNNVKSLYAVLNYEMQYPMTIYYQELRKASLNQYGYNRLIEMLIASLGTAKEIDRYFATIAVLANPNIYANGIENITYNSGEIGKTAVETIVNVAGDFLIPKTTNNKLGVTASTYFNNIVLVIKRELLNSINLNYLTGVYNLNKVDLIDSSNIIAIDSFAVNYINSAGETATTTADIDFVLVDRFGFDNHVALDDSEFIYNPRNKAFNYFANMWAILAYKYYKNARAFKMVESTPTT